MTTPSCTTPDFDQTQQMVGGGRVINFNLWGKDEPEKIDFQRINAIAISNMEAVLSHYLPGGKLVKNEYVCGSIYGGAGESCSTNIHTGVGSEFAAGVNWGDPVDLVAKVRGLRMIEAAQHLSDFLNIQQDTPTPKIEKISSVEKYEAGKRNALDLWVNSDICPNNHPYLAKKQVDPDPGIRLHRETGQIIIPLYDETGTLWSVQRISADGSEKKINNNGRMTGNFFTISGERDTVYICEGYATAKTVAMATGKTAVMAVVAGNLAAVGEKVAKLYPTSYLVFAADNDNVTPTNPGQIKNPGITMAEKAVKQIGRGTVIAPPAAPETKVDWNDLALMKGLDEVRREIEAAAPQKESLFESALYFLLQQVKVEYFIHRLFEVCTLISLTGPSGQFKSFVAICIACSIATGRDWYGRKVKQGHVLYLAGEGREGVKRRVAAYAIANNLTPDDLAGFHLSRHTLMMDGSNIDQIVAEASQLDVVLVIVDTLARHIVGHENDTQEMGAFVNCVDRLKAMLQAAALVVHHTGHDQTRGRGNSAYKAALDVEIMCDRGVLTFTKMKDAEPPEPIEFKLVQVEIGKDTETGEPITSAVVEYGERSANSRSGLLTRMEQIAVNALIEAAVKAQSSSEKVGALVGDWRATFYEMRKADLRKEHSSEEDAAAAANVPKKTLESSFKRAQEGLTIKKIIGEKGHLRVLLLPEHRDEVATRMAMPPMDAGCIKDASGCMHPAADSGCMDAPPLRGASYASHAGSTDSDKVPDQGRSTP